MTTYTWLNKQGVRTSDGLEVQRTGRFTIEVRLGHRKKVLNPDSVPPDAFEFWDNSSVQNDREEQQRLLRAFEAAREFMARNRPP